MKIKEKREKQKKLKKIKKMTPFYSETFLAKKSPKGPKPRLSETF